VPATRSRGENWKTSLAQIVERGGCLELAVRRADEECPASGQQAQAQSPSPVADLLWRVKLARVEPVLTVERPAAAGKAISLQNGTPLTVSMCIGQNRWKFHSAVKGSDDRFVYLQSPETVQRCSRREFLRAETAGLRLPEVRCWPIRDPMTAVPFEIAFRTLGALGGNGQTDAERVAETSSGLGTPPASELAQGSLCLPQLGPGFVARLLNISGGGVGLIVDHSNSMLLDSAPFLWMQIDLRPELRTPLAVTARRAHQHMDAGQNICVGLAFEFTCHPEHQKYVNLTLAAYVDGLIRSGKSQLVA